MKAIIVEVKGKYAIALNSSGEFIKIKNNEYKLGYEYDLTSYRNNAMKSFMKIASVAAAFFIVLGMSYGTYSYSKPYSYVDIDINPSIELTVNKFDRIISSKAYNEDGKKLLTGFNINNIKLQEGVEVLLDKAIEQGYIKQNTENAVILAVSSKNNKKAQKLESEVQVLVSNKLGNAEVETEIVSKEIAAESHIDAEELGISPGKMHLINKLIEAKPELKAEDLKDDEVKDIMKSIKEEKKKEIESNKLNKAKENNNSNNNNNNKEKNNESNKENNKEKEKNKSKSKDKDKDKSKGKDKIKDKEEGRVKYYYINWNFKDNNNSDNNSNNNNSSKNSKKNNNKNKDVSKEQDKPQKSKSK